MLPAQNWNVMWCELSRLSEKPINFSTAMLDELMGRNRNYDPNDKNAKEIRWSDSGVCRFYLVEFCPHELFTNTKADLVSSNWSFIYMCVHKFAVSIYYHECSEMGSTVSSFILMEELASLRCIRFSSSGSWFATDLVSLFWLAIVDHFYCARQLCDLLSKIRLFISSCAAVWQILLHVKNTYTWGKLTLLHTDSLQLYHCISAVLKWLSIRENICWILVKYWSYLFRSEALLGHSSSHVFNHVFVPVPSIFLLQELLFAL